MPDQHGAATERRSVTARADRVAAVRRRTVVRLVTSPTEPVRPRIRPAAQDRSEEERARRWWIRPGRLARASSDRDARFGPRWLVVGLTLALVAAVLAAGFIGRRWYDEMQLDHGRHQALAAARQTTVDFVSISAATVDRDLQRILGGASGDFKDELTQDLAQVKAAVVDNKVQSTGTVLRAGLVSFDRDRAVALVAVDATVHNRKAPAGRLSHYRIQVSLAKDPASGRWLVTQLQFVG